MACLNFNVFLFELLSSSWPFDKPWIFYVIVLRRIKYKHTKIHNYVLPVMLLHVFFLSSNHAIDFLYKFPLRKPHSFQAHSPATKSLRIRSKSLQTSKAIIPKLPVTPPPNAPLHLKTPRRPLPIESGTITSGIANAPAGWNTHGPYLLPVPAELRQWVPNHLLTTTWISWNRGKECPGVG